MCPHIAYAAIFNLIMVQTAWLMLSRIKQRSLMHRKSWMPFKINVLTQHDLLLVKPDVETGLGLLKIDNVEVVDKHIGKDGT